ncbi:MAG TPA: hypothetical protein VG406_23650 [Isosphaeraceae bacterium]|jgi:hypothetical protein|nr:hypothetical protein [Isosphaeraceae bacterium]
MDAVGDLDDWGRSHPATTDNLIARWLGLKSEEERSSAESHDLRSGRVAAESALAGRLLGQLAEAGRYDGVRVGDLAIVPVEGDRPRLDLLKLVTPDDLSRELATPTPAE